MIALIICFAGALSIDAQPLQNRMRGGDRMMRDQIEKLDVKDREPIVRKLDELAKLREQQAKLTEELRALLEKHDIEMPRRGRPGPADGRRGPRGRPNRSVQ